MRVKTPLSVIVSVTTGSTRKQRGLGRAFENGT